VPNGRYRFVVDGAIHQGGGVSPYHVVSRPFTVSSWTGLRVTALSRHPDGSVSFTTAPVVYPRSYASPIRLVHDDGGGRPGSTSLLCRTCTFRPWATHGEVVSAVVSVVDSRGRLVRTVPARLVRGTWYAATRLHRGETARVLAGGLRDAYGETNATPFP
jgi:hypothetical protein